MTNLTAYSLSVLFLSGLLGLVFLAATFPIPAVIIVGSLAGVSILWMMAETFKSLSD